MKERVTIKPILFNTDMVRAILDGRKTQTRRVIKDMAHPFFKVICQPNENGIIVVSEFDGDGNQICMTERQSKYHVGDILWVRETWGIGIQLSGGIVYKADYTDRTAPLADGEKWKPSIHMPKEAARLFLRVTEVRAGKLQETTLSDIESEGLYCDPPFTKDHFAYIPGMMIHWEKLWDSLYAERGYGWDTNPWVWVYEFERIDKETYFKL